MPETAIVLAAFGTSVEVGQQAYEEIDSAVRAAYPQHAVHWAFSSRMITAKLRKLGRTSLFARKTELHQFDEILPKLAERGLRQVVVQSLHVVPGEEYHKLCAIDSCGLQVRFGRPLLQDDAAIDDLIEALAPRFIDDGVSVLAGHGNDKHDEYNRELLLLDQRLRTRYPQALLATVEGRPGTDEPFARIAAMQPQRVRFVPMMVVAGDHIMNDVMGDEEDSWRVRLSLPADCEPGLGSNPAVQRMFLDRLHDCMGGI